MVQILILSFFFHLPNTLSTFEEAIIITKNLIPISWDMKANAEQYNHHMGKTTQPPGTAGFFHTDAPQQLQGSVTITPKR